MRKLVTIREIAEIRPIEKADAIECVVVDGWTVVSKKGEFKEGDLCIFFEIDSFLPADRPEFEFLAKQGTKKDPAGVERIRLKTVKLRGQISQGLALPISNFPELSVNVVGEDVTNQLNVIKYERPEPTQANAAGNFPEFLKKTDEERIQNIFRKYSQEYVGIHYIPTLKMDGSSCTLAFLGEDMKEYWEEEGSDKSYSFFNAQAEKIAEVIVCSRNLQLKYSPDNHFWKAIENYLNYELLQSLYDVAVGGSFAIQGEVCGPGIQGNKEKLLNFEFFAFNLFDIKKREYLAWKEAEEHFFFHGIQAVLNVSKAIEKDGDGTPIMVFNEYKELKDLLDYSDGRSLNAKYREGIVWKPAYSGDVPSFKVISNKFLLKGGDE